MPPVLSQPGRPSFSESPSSPGCHRPALSRSLCQLSSPEPRASVSPGAGSCRRSVPPPAPSKESGTLLAFWGCSRGSQGTVWLLMAMTARMTSPAAPEARAVPVLPRREARSRCQRAPVSNGVGGSAGVPAGRCCQAGGSCRVRSVILLGCSPKRGVSRHRAAGWGGSSTAVLRVKGELRPWGAQQCPAAPFLGGCRGFGDSHRPPGCSCPSRDPAEQHKASPGCCLGRDAPRRGKTYLGWRSR